MEMKIFEWHPPQTDSAPVDGIDAAYYQGIKMYQHAGIDNTKLHLQAISCLNTVPTESRRYIDAQSLILSIAVRFGHTFRSPVYAFTSQIKIENDNCSLHAEPTTFYRDLVWYDLHNMLIRHKSTCAKKQDCSRALYDVKLNEHLKIQDDPTNTAKSLINAFHNGLILYPEEFTKELRKYRQLLDEHGVLTEVVGPQAQNASKSPNQKQNTVSATGIKRSASEHDEGIEIEAPPPKKPRHRTRAATPRNTEFSDRKQRYHVRTDTIQRHVFLMQSTRNAWERAKLARKALNEADSLDATASVDNQSPVSGTKRRASHSDPLSLEMRTFKPPTKKPKLNISRSDVRAFAQHQNTRLTYSNNQSNDEKQEIELDSMNPSLT